MYSCICIHEFPMRSSKSSHLFLLSALRMLEWIPRFADLRESRHPQAVGNLIKPGIPNQSAGQIYKNKDLKIRQKHEKSWNIWQNSQMACQIKSTIIGNNLNLNPPQAWSDEEEAQLLEIWQILTKAEIPRVSPVKVWTQILIFQGCLCFLISFGCWKFRNWWILLNAIVKTWCK